MTKTHGSGCLSSKLRIFVLLWVFLQNVVVEFGGELMYIYYKKVEIPELHYTYSPEHWICGGAIFGGLLILILDNKVDIKNHFCAIRSIQIVGIALLIGLYKLQGYAWAQKYLHIGLYSIFFFQGGVSCMSQALTPVYVMETICDRDLDEAVAFLLLVTTQLPLYLSSFIARLLATNRLFLTVGIGIFGGMFFLVLIFYIFLPKSIESGTGNDKTEYVDYWHLQFESQAGWLRPALSAMSLCLLSQLTGIHIYYFYSVWPVRLANLAIGSSLFNSVISFISISAALVIWSKDKLPYFLVISTAVLAVSSFLTGIILHGLEGGSNINNFAPLTIHFVFVAAYTVGLGSLPEIVSILIVPRNYRLSIISVMVILSFVAKCLSDSVIPTLIQWFHPFGVFFLHSGITILGLLYITLTILGQISSRNYPEVIPVRPTVEEFITQV